MNAYELAGLSPIVVLALMIVASGPQRRRREDAALAVTEARSAALAERYDAEGRIWARLAR